MHGSLFLFKHQLWFKLSFSSPLVVYLQLSAMRHSFPYISCGLHTLFIPLPALPIHQLRFILNLLRTTYFQSLTKASFPTSPSVHTPLMVYTSPAIYTPSPLFPHTSYNLSSTICNMGLLSYDGLFSIIYNTQIFFPYLRCTPFSPPTHTYQLQFIFNQL